VRAVGSVFHCFALGRSAVPSRSFLVRKAATAGSALSSVFDPVAVLSCRHLICLPRGSVLPSRFPLLSSLLRLPAPGFLFRPKSAAQSFVRLGARWTDLPPKVLDWVSAQRRSSHPRARRRSRFWCAAEAILPAVRRCVSAKDFAAAGASSVPCWRACCQLSMSCLRALILCSPLCFYCDSWLSNPVLMGNSYMILAELEERHVVSNL
jgi:hypothetical protein